MPNIFLLADLHLNHEMVARLRGFASAEDHDDALERRWLEQIRGDDEVWLLGDLAMGERVPHLERIASWPGVKHVVLGNHDRAHPSNSNPHRHQAAFSQLFRSVQTGALLRHDGLRLLLSHFPYDGDHTDEERFAQWRLRDLGKPIIHGHTHATERLSRSAAGSTQLCVSVDAWPRAFATLGECVALIRGFEQQS